MNLINLDFGPNATSGELQLIIGLPCGNYAVQSYPILISTNPDCLSQYCVNMIDTITNPIITAASNPDIFHSISILKSDGQIPIGKNLFFKAENSIELMNGFEIIGGALFEAAIEDCPND